MREKHHMSADINGILKHYARKKINFITDDNGNEMSDKQARDELKRLLYIGHKLIPMGDCEGFDPFGKGCPGHEIPEETTNTPKDDTTGTSK